MIKYKITTQMENGEIVILNSEFENDKKLKEYMEEYVEPFAFVISTERVEEPNENLFTYTKNHQGIENWILVKVIETNETFPFDRGDQNEEELATMLNGFIKTRGYREE